MINDIINAMMLHDIINEMMLHDIINAMMLHDIIIEMMLHKLVVIPLPICNAMLTHGEVWTIELSRNSKNFIFWDGVRVLRFLTGYHKPC